MRIVFSLYFNSFTYIGEKKDENCTSIRTENSLALLIPNHFVLDDCPRAIAIKFNLTSNTEQNTKENKEITVFTYFLYWLSKASSTAMCA